MKMIDCKPFLGQHCETVATGSLLFQLGIELSEPMLFGLGEGLGFIYWNMKSMDMPFIGGRIKPDLLTQNIAKNLNLKCNVVETNSKQKAWDEVKLCIDQGKLVGLKVDCFHLEYFSNPIHFAGHYVAMYGYDNDYAYLFDTVQQGSIVKTSLASLALARSEKGAMSSKNLFYTLEKKSAQYDLSAAIKRAIKANAIDFLNPPITNIGYKGIAKTSSEIVKWFKASSNIQYEFSTTAMLMEKAGTGGSLFRNLYRDFLKESYDLVQVDAIRQGHLAYVEIATIWNTIAELFSSVNDRHDMEKIMKASALLKDVSNKEKEAMQLLQNV